MTDRCFWVRLAKVPKGVSSLVFVSLCDGAWLTGNPEDCSCDSWPVRLEAAQSALALERRRAKRAEDALERERARIREVLRRAGFDRYGRRLR